MSAAIPETLRDVKSFSDAMVKLHTLIHAAQMDWLGGDKELVEIDNRVLEYIRGQIEWLSNIDTPAKEKILFKLISMEKPKVDFEIIAKELS